NTVFTVMVGEKDTMYGRYDRDKKFKETIEHLRAEHADAYPVSVRIVEGNGHTGLPDRDKIVPMYTSTRQAFPRNLNCLMTDNVIRDFFWLHTDQPGKNREIEAGCHDNHITVHAGSNVTQLTLVLDRRLVDLDQPVIVEFNGQTTTHHLRP